jgi:hypothetical protein
VWREGEGYEADKFLLHRRLVDLEGRSSRSHDLSAQASHR